MRIAATFSRGALINASYVLSLPDFAANVTSQLDAAILVNSAPASTPAQAKADIEAALADYPNVTVNSPDDITEKAQSSVNQLLGLVTALACFLAVFRGRDFLGHRQFFTLILSVGANGRVSSFGCLRAVLAAPGARCVPSYARQSVLMSLLGALTGVALGVREPGIALSRALADQGVSSVSVPGPSTSWSTSWWPPSSACSPR